MTTSRSIAAALLFAGAIAAAPAFAGQDDSSDIESAPNSGFRYELPEAADAYPGLVRQLGAERERERIGFEERLAEAREYAPDAPWANNLTYDQQWGIAGRSGQLMSLASEIYRYDGGAHGNTAYDARIWHLGADRSIAFPALFTDRYAAYSVIDADFCRLLAAMQRDRDIDVSGDDLWGGCPLLHEQTIVPQGEPGRPFTAIGVYVPPYVAGPYVAGSFEISVEVTPELVALVRPEFRDSFAVPSGM